MKNIFFISFLIYSTFAFSQLRNVIKINTVNLLHKEISLGYERAVGDRISFSVWIPVLYNVEKEPAIYSDTAVVITGVKYIGYGIIADARFFLIPGLKEPPEGFYLSAYFIYRNFIIDINGTEKITGVNVEGSAKNVVLGGGGMLGYQFVFNDFLTLDLFAGIGRMNTDPLKIGLYSNGNKKSDYIPILPLNGIWPRIGVSFGLVF